MLGLCCVTAPLSNLPLAAPFFEPTAMSLSAKFAAIAKKKPAPGGAAGGKKNAKLASSAGACCCCAGHLYLCCAA